MISIAVFALVSFAALTSAFTVQSVEASESVYIRSDGNVEPWTAPILTADKVTYTFIGDIHGSIVVERDKIVIDGGGYSVDGKYMAGVGILLQERTNVTVRDLKIRDFQIGIYVVLSTEIGLYENDIESNTEYGVYSVQSSNSVFAGNNIVNNVCGVRLDRSFEDWLFHNNFVGNKQQVILCESVNVWDAGYPCGGNYWSDYVGVDLARGEKQDQLGSDGVGDIPYKFDENNLDRYPLVELWSPPPMVRIFIRVTWLWGLTPGKENSLTSKLDDAIHLFDMGNANGAICKMGDYFKQVRTLQDAAQKQQQLFNILSNVLKSMHDQARAVINNFR